jgi:hypothetical protein
VTRLYFNRFIHPDGRLRHRELSSSVFEDCAGNISRSVIAVTDISGMTRDSLGRRSTSDHACSGVVTRLEEQPDKRFVTNDVAE